MMQHIALRYLIKMAVYLELACDAKEALKYANSIVSVTSSLIPSQPLLAIAEVASCSGRRSFCH